MTAVDRAVLDAAVTAAAQAGRDAALASGPTMLPGVVVSIDPTNTMAVVAPDGPTETTTEHGAAILAPVTVVPGDRVMLLYTGTAPGCYVLGRRQGDWNDWHVVGQPGEPAFLNAWAHSPGALPPGQNGFGQVMFTMRSGRVELRGQCERSTGAAGIFNLPEPYWPDNDLIIPVTGALGTFASISIEFSSGLVSMVTGDASTVVVFDGVSYLARIQQVN